MDYPGVCCEACEEIREKDGVDPDCETEKGCVLPPIGPVERRILEIRDRLVALQGLVGSGAVLKIYGAGRWDMELLARVEKELKSNAPKGDAGT